MAKRIFRDNMTVDPKHIKFIQDEIARRCSSYVKRGFIILKGNSIKFIRGRERKTVNLKSRSSYMDLAIELKKLDVSIDIGWLAEYLKTV
jgi:hypothetical protein